jgi:hypothetical protein
LLKAIVRAHGWKERILAGQIYSIQQLASEAKVSSRYVVRILRLAALSPKIVDGMVHDGSMADYSLSQFMKGLPLNWNEQGSLLSQG